MTFWVKCGLGHSAPFIRGCLKCLHECLIFCIRQLSWALNSWILSTQYWDLGDYNSKWFHLVARRWGGRGGSLGCSSWIYIWGWKDCIDGLWSAVLHKSFWEEHYDINVLMAKSQLMCVWDDIYIINDIWVKIPLLSIMKEQMAQYCQNILTNTSLPFGYLCQCSSGDCYECNDCS